MGVGGVVILLACARGGLPGGREIAHAVVAVIRLDAVGVGRRELVARDVVGVGLDHAAVGPVGLCEQIAEGVVACRHGEGLRRATVAELRVVICGGLGLTTEGEVRVVGLAVGVGVLTEQVLLPGHAAVGIEVLLYVGVDRAIGTHLLDVCGVAVCVGVGGRRVLLALDGVDALVLGLGAQAVRRVVGIRRELVRTEQRVARLLGGDRVASRAHTVAGLRAGARGLAAGLQVEGVGVGRRLRICNAGRLRGDLAGLLEGVDRLVRRLASRAIHRAVAGHRGLAGGVTQGGVGVGMYRSVVIVGIVDIGQRAG